MTRCLTSRRPKLRSPDSFRQRHATEDRRSLGGRRPVVSTTLGAEGLPARHGENILLADDPAAFADAVSSLLESCTERERIGRNGREQYENDLTWNAAWRFFCARLRPPFGPQRVEPHHAHSYPPIVPGHEIVGRVTKVGSAVTKYKPGDLAAVGCLVDSDRTCPRCKVGLENFCPNLTLTFNSPDKHLGGVTYGGYSDSIVVDETFRSAGPR